MKRILGVLKLSVVYSLFICSLEYLIYFLLDGYKISFPLFWRNLINYIVFFTLFALFMSLPFIFSRIKKLYLSFALFPATFFFLMGYYMDKYHAGYFFSNAIWKVTIGAFLVSFIISVLLTYFEKPLLHFQVFFSILILLILVFQRVIWNWKSPPSRPGNGIIIVLADAMRADKLNQQLTPNLYRFAMSSSYYTNAHSAASCTIPSVFALMTGKLAYIYPEDRDAKRALRREGTLADFLRRNGYATIGISANRLVSPMLGFDRGFQKFINVGLEWWRFSLYKPAYNIYFPMHHIKIYRYLSFVPFKVRDSANFLNSEAISFIKKYRGKKFFLYIHYMDPHAPYSPPKFLLKVKKPSWNHLRPLMGQKLDRGFPVNTSAKLTPDLRYSLQTLYDAEIAYMDSEISNLLNALRETGFLGRGTFVFLADHGEEFWDHGGLSHCHSLKEELIRVPLIINSPSLKKGIFHKPVSSNFLVNSFLKSNAIPDFSKIYSVTWHKKGRKKYRFRDMFSIIKYPRKIIGEWRKLKGKTWWVFDSYNLQKDPKETTSLPLTEEEKEEIKVLEKQLKNKLKRVALKGSRKYIETLRALGYVK